MENFDWKVTNSKQILKDRWISLRADRCVMPTGTVLDPYYVLEYPDWTNIAAITPEKEMVLIRHYRHGIGKTVIELPAGCIDKQDPSPAESAERELLEETGYKGSPMKKLCKISANPATHTNLTHGFLTLNAEKIQEQTLDDTEQIEVILAPLPRVMKLLDEGAFYQSLNISTLFYAFRELKKEGYL